MKAIREDTEGMYVYENVIRNGVGAVTRTNFFGREE